MSGMIHVTEEFIRRSCAAQEIEKICGGNFMRVFSKVIELREKNPAYVK